MKRLLSLLAALLLTFATPVMAGEIVKSIEVPMNRVITILKDPALQDPAKRQEQYEAIWKIVQRTFDFNTISMLATGKHWRRFTATEKQVFESVFAELLGNTYIEKVRDNFRDETVLFDSEEIIGKNKSQVKSRIVLPNGSVPIQYRLRKRGGDWKIYDIRIEGISLVKNYRSQFDSYLFNHKPAELIDELLARLKKADEARKNKKDKSAPEADRIPKPVSLGLES